MASPPSSAIADDTSIGRGPGTGVVSCLALDLKLGRNMVYPITTVIIMFVILITYLITLELIKKLLVSY